MPYLAQVAALIFRAVLHGQMGQADDAVERRADLMAYLGEEFALGLGGHDGLALFFLGTDGIRDVQCDGEPHKALVLPAHLAVDDGIDAVGERIFMRPAIGGAVIGQNVIGAEVAGIGIALQTLVAEILVLVAKGKGIVDALVGKKDLVRMQVGNVDRRGKRVEQVVQAGIVPLEALTEGKVRKRERQRIFQPVQAFRNRDGTVFPAAGQTKIADELVLVVQGQTVQGIYAALLQLGTEFAIPAVRDVVEVIRKLHLTQGHKGRERHPDGIFRIRRHGTGKPELRLICPSRNKEHAISAVTGKSRAEGFQSPSPERGNVFTGKRNAGKSGNELQIILRWWA